MVGGLGGDLLTALLTAGAFAAFLATSSGLTIAVAGVISQDVMSKRARGVTAFRVAAVVAVVVPFAARAGTRDVARRHASVGLAFAMAAATFCPLLVLGIWWRGLTDVGALAGLLVGGVGSPAARCWTTCVTDRTGGWFAVLLAQPAAWAVPLAFAHDGRSSRWLTRHRVPAHACAVHGPAAHPGDRRSSTAAEPSAATARRPTSTARPIRRVRPASDPRATGGLRPRCHRCRR